jgi:signal peptidase I
LDTHQGEIISGQVNAKGKRSGCSSVFIDTLETLILAAILFVSINLISARIRVDGDSMVPTLISGEYVVVNRLSYRLGSPQRGDIIVFHFPRNPQEEYIKRIIGLPGDVIEVMNGAVNINGQPLDENYLNVETNYTGRWEVPADQFFVLGDNRNNSSDSHDWGMVPMDYVVGKAIIVYWPPPNWGIIDHVSLANAAR